MKETSQKFTLLTVDREKWVRNQLDFLKPLVAVAGTMYLAPILVLLQTDGHVLSLQDFRPSTMVVSAIAYYFVSAVYDLLRKWVR